MLSVAGLFDLVALVRVRDIGRAEDGTKEQRSVSRLDGKPAVSLEIRRQSGANTIAVIEGVKCNIPNRKCVKDEGEGERSKKITKHLFQAPPPQPR